MHFCHYFLIFDTFVFRLLFHTWSSKRCLTSYRNFSILSWRSGIIRLVFTPMTQWLNYLTPLAVSLLIEGLQVAIIYIKDYRNRYLIWRILQLSPKSITTNMTREVFNWRTQISPSQKQEGGVERLSPTVYS